MKNQKTNNMNGQPSPTLADMLEGRQISEFELVEVKGFAKTASRLSLTDITLRTGISKSVLQRIFTAEDYHPSLESITPICKALGNNILIEYLYATVGGRFVLEDEVDTVTDLKTGVASLTAEFADVLKADAALVLDGINDVEEVGNLINELDELIKQATGLMNGLKKKKMELQIG